jgi:P4 family phage/plasmid primase-like protien
VAEDVQAPRERRDYYMGVYTGGVSGTPETSRFYRHLFGGGRGYMALFSGRRSSDGGLEQTESRYFEYPSGASEALRHAAGQSQAGREVYHCCHLLAGKRRIKANAGEVFALWGDLDGVDIPNDPLEPTAVIESSPGRFHIYYRLTAAIPPEVAEELNKRLARKIGADPSGFDLTQLLRVPNTTNNKYPDAPTVEIKALDAGRSYSPAELDKMLPEIEEPNQSGGRTPPSGEPPVQLNDRGLRVWCGEDPKLKDSGELDRSGSLMKIGRALYDSGANREVIERALEERDGSIGWHKYTGRRDAGVRYSEIVDELERPGRNGHVAFSVGKGREERKADDGESEKIFNTDLGNSRRFVRRFREIVRFCYPWESWIIYDGKRWKPDTSGEIQRLGKEITKVILREAAAAPDDDTRKALAKHALATQSATRIRDMLALAKSDVPVQPEDFDQDPYLLNVTNGTLDLRTGELRPHDRGDFMTRLAPVEFDPEAIAPTWTAFLERVLPSKDVRTFLQRLAGYTLTGDVSEHVLPVLYGVGANGKSTAVNAILEAVGEYGIQAAPEILMAKRGGHPTEVADLFGCRFASVTEVEDGRRLNEALVKQITGGDRIRARRMRQDFWEFSPTHKVILSVNHKPEIRGTDTGIWRRIRLVPFTEVVPLAEQDTKLPEKLRRELPGILRWMAAGCLEWQSEGLNTPAAVTTATDEYREDMDSLGEFLSGCCLQGSSLSASAKSLWSAYRNWSKDNNEHEGTQKRFGTRLRERGFLNDRDSRTGRKAWFGLSLSEEGRQYAEQSLNDSNTLFAGKTQNPEPSEPKNDISSLKNNPHVTMSKKGSDGSDGSVETSEPDDDLPNFGPSAHDRKLAERTAEAEWEGSY